MSHYLKYNRIGQILARPWKPDDVMCRTSIRPGVDPAVDKGYVVKDAKTGFMWYVERQWFLDMHEKDWGEIEV